MKTLMKPLSSLFTYSVCFLVMVGCEKDNFYSDIFVTRYNTSDEVIDVLILKDDLHGVSVKDYCETVYTMYQSDSIFSETDKFYLVRLYDRITITKRNIWTFYQDNQQDTSHTFSINYALQGFKNN